MHTAGALDLAALPDLTGAGADPFRGLPEITLDWDAYYRKFKAAHGEPVLHDGKLLFPDGWTYAADVAGPEWPPPEDPGARRMLQARYWETRREVVRLEHRLWILQLEGLQELQDSKSVPLQQRRRVTDEKTGTTKSESGNLNLDDFRQGRLAWLTDDLKECDRKLAELACSASPTSSLRE